MAFAMLVDGSQTGHPYVATGLTKLSVSFRIVLVESDLVSIIRLIEKNERSAFFLSSSIACLKEPFRENWIPR